MISRSTRRITLSLLAVLLMGTHAQARPARPDPKAGAEVAKAAEGVVNINTATEDQLRLLPGIGPVKARAVIKHREKSKFTGTHQIIRVKGIGRKTYQRLRPYLTIQGPTTLTSRPRPARPAEE
jgi:competence protein ComEA